MLLLYKTYVRFILEYCCPLWAPHTVNRISMVESVQRSFTSKIDGMQGLNYWQRLEKLNMFSLQRRRERYAIILVWKMNQQLIPDCIGASFKSSDRRGETCTRAIGKSKYASTNTQIHNSFSSKGPAIFNAVPSQIRAIETLEPFKAHLDKWLHSFPDTPPSPGYVAANRNSILDWVSSRSN